MIELSTDSWTVHLISFLDSMVNHATLGLHFAGRLPFTKSVLCYGNLNIISLKLTSVHPIADKIQTNKFLGNFDIQNKGQVVTNLCPCGVVSGLMISSVKFVF